MKKIHNIFIKMFLLLALAIGWGGSAWAQTSAFSFTSWDHDTFSQLTEYNTPIFISDTFTTTQEGDLSVRIAYNGGNWAFPAFGVDLVNQSGEVVKTNYAYHKLGTNQNFTYTLTGVPVGTYTLRYWTCSRCEDGSMYQHKTNNPAITAISFTGSTVGATPSRTAISRTDLKEACITAKGIPSDLWSIVQTNLSTGAGLLYKDDACTLDAGHYTMKFTYSGGDSSSHNERLNLRGVELRDGSGNVVSSDCHVGYTGSAQSNTTYSFDVPTAGSYTVRTIVLPEDGTSTCPQSKGNIAYTFEAAAAAVDVDCTFDPADGSTVADLSTVTLTADQNIVYSGFLNEFDSSILEVKPVLKKAGSSAIEAASVDGLGTTFTIAFPTPIPDGDYTLEIPKGAFYAYVGYDPLPVSRMTVDYTLQTIYNVDPANELTLDPATGTRVQESLSSVTITINPAGGEIVKSAEEEGTGYTDDNTPYLISAATPSNQRGNKAPAGATLASSVSKTGKGVYSITFDPAVTTLGDYTLVIPQGAFYVGDVPAAEMSANYTLAGAVVDWTITLTDGAGTNHVFTIPSDAADLTQAAVLTQLDMPGVTLTGYTSDPASHTATATVEFPFKASSATVKNYVTIDAFTANHQFWYTTSASDTEVTVNLNKGSEEGAKWAIIPHVDASGQFTFNIYNALTGKYINTDGKSSGNNASLSSTPSGFVLASDNEFKNPTNNLYLSVSSSSGSGQKLLAYSVSHGGTKLTFTGTTAPAILGNDVNLRFVDEGGNDIANGSVTFISGDGSRVTLSGTSYDFQDIVYSKSHFCASFDYKPNDVVYDQVSNTLTFTVAFNKWYTVKSNAGNRYLSSDYADAQGLKMQNGNNPAPTTYGGLWRMVETGTAARNSGGVNINMFNAKYFDTQVLGMGGDNWNQSSGNAARAFMFATDAVPDNYCQNFEQRLNGSNQTFRVDWTKANNSYFNVYSGYLSLWNSGSGYGDANGVFTIEEVPILGIDVVVTVNTPAGVTVKYNTQCESASFLSAYAGQVQGIEMTNGMHFNFHNMPFLPSLFSFEPADVTKTLTATFDKDAQTLSLTVATDPNILQFSDAPENGAWAADTKWFTIHNNRNNKGYLSTQDSGEYLDDAGTLTIKNGTDASGNRGGLWTFVPQDGGGFNIYNNAYGPDFILGLTGNSGSARLNMYQKDAVPSGVSTLFTHGENSSRDGSASTAYYFRIGLTGTNHLNEQSGYAGTWAPTGANANKCESDQGSAFTVTAISDDDLATLQAYDIYRVSTTVSSELYTSLDYTPTANTFGKRSTAKEGDFLILNHGAATDVANFTIEPSTEFTILQTQVKEVAGHYYKRLIIDIDDPLATESYTVRINDKTNNQSFNLSDVAVDYNGIPYQDGDIFKLRPEVLPRSIDFVIKDNATLHDKFIWGPVIDSKSMTVTFDIRPLATELTEGWYMFQVENAADVNAINSRINYYPGNYNEVSNLQYLMESRFGKCKMKFTGVGGYDERYAYMHVSKDGQYINLRGDNAASQFSGLAYTFADGRLTLTGCSVDGTTLEPMEMPALAASGSGITFRATPISLDQWEVYRINFDFGSATAPDPLSAVYTVNEATGSKKEIHHDDFLILPHNSSVAATTVNRYAFNKDDDGTPVASVTSEGIKVSVDSDNDGATNVLTFHLAPAQKKYVVFIKAGEGLSDSEKDAVAGYKAVVRSTGAEFATTAFDAENHIYSAAINLPCTMTVDATTFKVDNESQFVWGPVVDENTYTFEIRKAATIVENGKWYQIQLKDEDIPSLIGNDKRPRNLVDMVNNQSDMPVYVRNRGSYIYAVSSRVSDNNYPLELTGMLPKANEKLNYVYIGSDGKIYSQNGSYVGINGTNSGTALMLSSTSDANNYFSWSSIGAASNSSTAPYITLGTWSGIANNRPLHLHLHEAPVTERYDVYQIHFTNASLVKKADYIGLDAVAGQMLNNLVENAFLFIHKDTWEITASPSNQRKAPVVMTKAELEAKLAKEFKALGYKTITVTVGDKAADGITPITLEVTDELSGMILHRQHAVYDNYYATAASERPADGDGFIHGSGWTTNPYTGTALQRTSVFKVTQYIKKGQDTRCYYPAASRNAKVVQLANYQRVYDYKTELSPTTSVIKGFYANDDATTPLTYNTNYSNGWILNSPAMYFIANLNGASEQIIGLDCSEYGDKGVVAGTTNYKEPSLAIRVLYTIRDARQLADALLDCKSSTGNYYQTNTYIVPTVMRGSAAHVDGASLLPLDMPWSNYWAYNSSTITSTSDADDKNNALVRLIEENVDVTNSMTGVTVSVSSNLAEYVEAGVFTDQGGLGNSDGKGKYLYSNGNHFVAYQLKKEVPDGMQGYVTVQFTAGTETYNIAKFNLEFQANTEPLIITSVVGTESRRWVNNLTDPDNEGYDEVGKLTFELKKKPFKNPGSTSEIARTYAFPLDFDKTCYAYGNEDRYSMYRITTENYNLRFRPAAVYENNITNRSNSVSQVADDYFLYIDAAEQPGVVASIPIEGNLCAGSKLYLSGYVGSVNTEAASTSGGVILRLAGIDSDGNSHPLVSYLPGMFSNWAYDTEGNAYNAMIGDCIPTVTTDVNGDTNKSMIWQQVGFEFMLDAGSAYPKYELDVINNCYSTKGGDYVLDDFHVCASIPHAKVDFSTPVCEDRVRHIKVHTLFNDLIKATGKTRVNSQAEYDALPESEKTMSVSYCFLDEEKFKSKLDELNPDPTHLTPANYNEAFNYALVGDYTFDRSNPNHAFHNFDVSRYFASVPAYSFKDSEDDNIYREIKNGTDYIIFKESVSHNGTDATPVNWVVGRKYLILYSTAQVTQAHINAGSVGTAVYQVNGSCYSSKEFTVRSSVSARSDIEYLDFDAMQACSGQTATFTVDMVASKPSGDVVERGLYYDYWIGDAGVDDGAGLYTIARNGSKADLEQKVLTEEFAKTALGSGASLPAGCSITTDTDGQHWHESYTFTETINDNGTVNDISSSPETKVIDYLITDILRDFRAAFPSVTADDFDLVVGPALAVDASYVFTPSMKAFIKALITPDPTTGRTPLVLRRQSFDLDLNINNTVVIPGSPAKRYIYFTAVPIVPQWGTYGNEDVMYCPAPKEFSINLLGDAPNVEDGFAGFPYPADMHNVPIRIGLHQIEATRLTSTEETNDALTTGRSKLIVPLRNIAAIYGKNNTVEANRLGGQMIPVDRYITGSTMPYVFLTHTDDPYYTTKIDNLIQNSIDHDLSLFPVGRVVSIVDENHQKTHGVDGHIDGMGELHMVFSSDFAPREGYTYTMKIDFLEKTNLAPEQSLPGDYVEPCPGSFIFDMKIVPEYQQWTAAADNTDWTNDGNWARADRDVLHADNAASDGTYPLASYLNNATNYHGDAQYSASEPASAHGFIPMYFTNVLMHDKDVAAPDLYNLTKPTKAGGQFLAGLESTASEMAKYDMLVTPVAADGSALALAQRYAAHTGNYGCELFWTNVCNGLTFEPGTMMYDAQHLQYNRVWVEYELSTNRWYTLASPLKNTYAGEWYSPEAGGRQLTPHFYPVTYNPALNDRFNPAYYQRSWDKAGQAWIYRMAGDDDTYVGFDQQNLNSGSVRVQKPVYLNWSYVYNDVAVDYSNGGFSVNVHYTDTDSDGHLLNATDGKVLVRMPKDDLSYDYYQSEAAAHYDETHPAGGNEQNPDPTQPGTVPGRDDYGNGDNDAGNNPDGSNADGSGNASGRNNANGNNNEYTPQQGNHSHNGDNTVLPGRSATVHPRLMSDDLNLSGGIIAQSIQNASATNPYYLVGNPFMAPMNMDKFFAQQTCTRGGQTGQPTFKAGKYWILNGTSQEANIKVDGQWVSTSAANAGVVAPLQGFFVQLPTNSAGQLLHPDAASSGASGVQLSFDKNVQQPMTVIDQDPNGKPIFGYITGEDGQGQKTYGEKPSLKSRRRSAELEQPAMFRITATNGSQLESTAVVYFNDKASAHYDAREDAETLLDGNIASKVSTVFTSAPSTGSGQAQQALQINTMPAGVTMIPVGVIAPKDDTRTTLRFTGLDALEAAMPETPHLYDADNGTLQVLDESTTVSVIGTTAGRYFIVSGTTLPVVDDNDDDNDDYDGRIYDLRGIRVNSVQHGTVTISRSRKEYNK